MIQRSLDRSIDCLGDSDDVDNTGIGEFAAEGSDAPLRKLVVLMIAEALQGGVEAIELEPSSDRVTAFMMTGGARRERDRMPLHMHKPIVAMIKRLSGIDVAARGQPQAGAMRADVDGHPVTFPVRVRATADGEAIGIDLPAAAHGVMATIKRRLHKPRVRLLEPAGGSVLELLAAQSAEGSFAILPPGVAGRTVESRQALESLPGVGSGAVTVMVLETTLCLLAFQTTHASRRDLWSRAHAKGVRYVATALRVKPEEVTAVLERLAQAPTAAAV